MDQTLQGSERWFSHLSLARRVLLAAAFGALVLLVGVVLLLSAFAGGALPWFVGVVLAAAVAGAIVAGLHAGGHGWFVPVPVVALAVAWGISASAAGAGSALSWCFAALTLLSALGALVMLVPAIAYRGAPSRPVGAQALIGATGTAVTALAPVGICRVNNETWTAQSVSGPLPPGAPVHVAKVEGVRLIVWSEAGTILGAEALAVPTLQEAFPTAREQEAFPTPQEKEGV
jgi:membrane-bound ClpP family serine protease